MEYRPGCKIFKFSCSKEYEKAMGKLEIVGVLQQQFSNPRTHLKASGCLRICICNDHLGAPQASGPWTIYSFSENLLGTWYVPSPDRGAKTE